VPTCLVPTCYHLLRYLLVAAAHLAHGDRQLLPRVALTRRRHEDDAALVRARLRLRLRVRVRVRARVRVRVR